MTMPSPDLDGDVEQEFGRARHIVLVDPESMEWEAVGNPGAGAGGGSGVRAAQLLAERGVSAVASGDFGPNAHAALTSAGIALHRFPKGTPAREAVQRIAREGQRSTDPEGESAVTAVPTPSASPDPPVEARRGDTRVRTEPGDGPVAQGGADRRGRGQGQGGRGQGGRGQGRGGRGQGRGGRGQGGRSRGGPRV